MGTPDYIIDTHAHIDGEEFRDDLQQTIDRAKAAGVGTILVPAINLSSLTTVNDVCSRYPGYAYPMIGLHPEEVKADWHDVLAEMKTHISQQYIAVGEVGLDFYWSRQYQTEQMLAFEEQVKWAADYGMPLVIHCRKAQNELTAILRKYRHRLNGGIFHCFTGNAKEAAELLAFDGFALGIGGVLTFKSGHLRKDLPAAVPLSRIVLETDCPYMAPVPHRGKRNESSFLPLICRQLAECYGTTPQTVAQTTTATATAIFNLQHS